MDSDRHRTSFWIIRQGSSPPLFQTTLTLMARPQWFSRWTALQIPGKPPASPTFFTHLAGFPAWPGPATSALALLAPEARRITAPAAAMNGLNPAFTFTEPFEMKDHLVDRKISRMAAGPAVAGPCDIA